MNTVPLRRATNQRAQIHSTVPHWKDSTNKRKNKSAIIARVVTMLTSVATASTCHRAQGLFLSPSKFGLVICDGHQSARVRPRCNIGFPPRYQSSLGGPLSTMHNDNTKYRSVVTCRGNNIGRRENDRTEENEKKPSNSASSSSEASLLSRTLLQNAVGRAVRTLSSNTVAGEDFLTSVETTKPTDKLARDAVQRAVRTMSLDTRESGAKPDGYTCDPPQSDYRRRQTSPLMSKVSVEAGAHSPQKEVQAPRKQQQQQQQHADKRTYLSHPAVTGTALAHSIWASTILPLQDTVIDATCGNGKDSLALARLLFPPLSMAAATDGEKKEQELKEIEPELVCIDVQERAVYNTAAALLAELGTGRFHDCVTVLQSSHAPLPKPRDDSSVGLVCYNLGYLPGGDRKDICTEIRTTLTSLADAALLVRIGGMVSVMTYPSTNMQEAMAVRALAEALAMLTTKSPGGWEGNLDTDSSLKDDVKMRVREEMRRVEIQGDELQTWRVFDHRPLGRPLSPILITIIRIK